MLVTVFYYHLAKFKPNTMLVYEKKTNYIMWLIKSNVIV